LHPDPCPSGVVLAGFNPLAVDWTATRLMGFDPAVMPLYVNAAKQMSEWVEGFTIKDCVVRSNNQVCESILRGDDLFMSFRAPAGWRGQIERYEIGNASTVPAVADPSALSQ